MLILRDPSNSLSKARKHCLSTPWEPQATFNATSTQTALPACVPLTHQDLQPHLRCCCRPVMPWSRHTTSTALCSQEEWHGAYFQGLWHGWWYRPTSPGHSRGRRGAQQDGGAMPSVGQCYAHRHPVPSPPGSVQDTEPSCKRKPNWYSGTIVTLLWGQVRNCIPKYMLECPGLSGPLGRVTAVSSCHHLPGSLFSYLKGKTQKYTCCHSASSNSPK